MAAINPVQDERIRSNRERLDKVDRHIENTNQEMGEIRDKLTRVVNDVSWLKKNYWMVAGAAIGSLVAALFNLLK